jgi:lactate dehydrogenase-like 2-hydroxyacid dehydrogenase
VPHRVLIAAELRNLVDSVRLSGLDVTWLAADRPMPRGDYVAVVPLLSRWVGGTEMKNLPRLRIVANCAAGHDNVDVVAAELRGVLVTHTPVVLLDATADRTWALILACARRLVEGIDLIRSGRWGGWHPEQLLGLELRVAAPRTVVVPHIGSATHETRRRMAGLAVDNVQAVLSGRPPLTPVYR